MNRRTFLGWLGALLRAALLPARVEATPRPTSLLEKLEPLRERVDAIDEAIHARNTLGNETLFGRPVIYDPRIPEGRAYFGIAPPTR